MADLTMDDVVIPFPFNMLKDDLPQFRRFVETFGSEQAMRLMADAARDFLLANGPRSALLLRELMDRADESLVAIAQEHGIDLDGLELEEAA